MWKVWQLHPPEMDVSLGFGPFESTSHPLRLLYLLELTPFGHVRTPCNENNIGVPQDQPDLSVRLTQHSGIRVPGPPGSVVPETSHHRTL
jgi:hypothetical protein